jgi:MaoC like domain
VRRRRRSPGSNPADEAVGDGVEDQIDRHPGQVRADAVVRFAGVVFPGETLRASIWKEGDKFASTVTAPVRDNAIVLTGVELSYLDGTAMMSASSP